MSRQSSVHQFEENPEELMCPICRELLVEAVLLNCSHTFCEVCIEEWKESNANSECPVCRAKISTQTRELVVHNMVDRVVAKMNGKQRREREKLVDDRKKRFAELQSSRAANSNSGNDGEREDFNADDNDSDSSENEHNSYVRISVSVTMHNNRIINSTVNIGDISDDEDSDSSSASSSSSSDSDD